MCISLGTMKRKILVLESDADILQIISHILTDEGYQPILCKTEQGIHEVIVQEKPDVILLDIVSPSEQGTRLCRTLKATAATSHIPVIVLSTHSRIEVVKEICADEVLKKPFDIDLLLDAVKEQLAA